MKFIVAFFCLGLAAATPTPHLDTFGHRIINGSVATLGQFPHQVALILNGNLYCGGSVIAPNWVLTAAHCVDTAAVSQVRAGTVTWNAGGELRTVAERLWYPTWDSSGLAYDYGLIRVAEPFTFGANLNRIRLATPTSPTTNCRVSGWGRTDHVGGPIPVDLHWTNTHVITDTECLTLLSGLGLNWHDDAHICTMNGQNGICNGDSGGALICQNSQGVWEQHGTNSFVISSLFNNCMLTYPNGYGQVSVQAVHDWINSNCDNCLNN